MLVFIQKNQIQILILKIQHTQTKLRCLGKNLRENVSFTYPITNAGTTPSFMTIYSNSAKNNDGSYDPIHTLAEIGHKTH